MRQCWCPGAQPSLGVKAGKLSVPVFPLDTHRAKKRCCHLFVVPGLSQDSLQPPKPSRMKLKMQRQDPPLLQQPDIRKGNTMLLHLLFFAPGPRFRLFRISRASARPVSFIATSLIRPTKQVSHSRASM